MDKIMENSFLELFSFKFLIMSLMCFGLTEVIKRLLNYEWVTNKFVQTVALPSLSVLIGGMSGLIMKNFVLGVCAGTLSSLVFAKVKTFLNITEDK